VVARPTKRVGLGRQAKHALEPRIAERTAPAPQVLVRGHAVPGVSKIRDHVTAEINRHYTGIVVLEDHATSRGPKKAFERNEALSLALEDDLRIRALVSYASVAKGFI
jgi:hypothetical protein